jgi:hypothetical protein
VITDIDVSSNAPALRIGNNTPAFVLGAGYFFVKDMWRKGLALLAAALAIAVAIVVSDVPLSVARAIGTGYAAANITNHTYFLHVIRHGRSWNFLEGFGRRTTYA